MWSYCYTRAAQELHLTQSALSRSIQAMEKHAGVKLFDRDRGSLSPAALMLKDSFQKQIGALAS